MIRSRARQTELYKKAQEASGLSEGDTVQVIGKAENYSYGWQDRWSLPMSDFIGDNKLYTILKMHPNRGCYLQDTSMREEFYFPYFVLRKVGSSETPEQPSIRDRIELISDYLSTHDTPTESTIHTLLSFMSYMEQEYNLTRKES